ncbi:MAG: PilZ domain-containing protein [Candidatus Acidiferrum sp.]
MSSPEPQPSKVSNLRRSQRVCLSVPVLVLKGGPGKNQTTEETCTLTVSPHGALIVLHLPVQPGDLLTIKHTKTEEELVCRVVHLGPDQSGKREVGVEFEHPSPRFWRIAFPPADWSPRNPDAKAPTVHSPIAKTLPRKPSKAAAESDQKQENKPPEVVPG